MKKLAIFVEGKTELIFVEKLLFEIGGNKNIRINKLELSGGSTCPLVERIVGIPIQLM